MLKLMSIESVMPSNHLVLGYPLLLLPSIFPSIKVFSNESTPRIRWPNIGASASASVPPINIHNWFPLGSTGVISLQSKGLSRISSQHHISKASILWSLAFFMVQLWSSDSEVGTCCRGEGVSLVPCDDLHGFWGGKRSKRVGIYVYI